MYLGGNGEVLVIKHTAVDQLFDMQRCLSDY